MTPDEVADAAAADAEELDLVVGPVVREGTMVEPGLQHIHGLSMAYNPESPHLIHHGPPGIYVRTLDMVRADLEKWIDECRRYDENPEEFRHLAWELARPYVEAERAKQRRPQREARGTADGLG
ncbi:hypothetical protein [Pengzhenrongella sp.]|uniref:hypothetical protein n=1 Tax=Pengzhenrongella sp. TaxID=2888820 RepID=UPI002F951BFD